MHESVKREPKRKKRSPAPVQAYGHGKENRKYVSPERVEYPGWSRNMAAGVVQAVVHPSFRPASYNQAGGHYELGNHAIEYMLDNDLNADDEEVWGPQLLRVSLVGDAGVRDSNQDRSGIANQAHHIVELRNNPEGRAILEAVGIDINSAANGVLLPTEEISGSGYGYDTGRATVHRGTHVAEYGQCVTEALVNATGKTPDELQDIAEENRPGIIAEYRKRVLGVLDRIRETLLTEHVPLNANVDADYSEENDGARTIEDIFRAHGLIP